MKNVAVLSGVLTYEFRMQIRRHALWLTFLFFALALSLDLKELITFQNQKPLLLVMTQWTMLNNTFMPLFIAFFLTDRFLRDERIKVDELLVTAPASLFLRLVGKYLGATLATLVPIFLFYCVGASCVLLHAHSLQVIVLVIELFPAIVLPGALFVSAISLACSVLIWPPLYQCLFIGYWFWGNILPPYPHSPFPVPTISDTLLTPIGSYISAGLFGVPAFTIQHATMMQGVTSMLLLLGISVMVIMVFWLYVKRYCHQR